jgi:F-type H+-transporting ATPase subunit delta
VEALRVFVSALEPLARLRPSGTADARRLEALLRASLAEAGFAPGGAGAETALRLITLLVRRRRFRYRQSLLLEVEKAADRAGGLVRVKLEAPEPVTAEFEAELKAALLHRTGAREIALALRINLELLGGYRLYLGSDVLDTSLKERLRLMGRSLANAEG